MSFFDEFKQLKLSQPHLSLRGFKNVNCEYNDYLYFSKNCYMCFLSDKFRDCFHCESGISLNDCCDCSECDRCELCFDSINCKDCFDGSFLQDCRRTSQSDYCFDCIGCNHCFGCAGLRQKSFCIFNEQVDAEMYNKLIYDWKELGLGAILEKFEEIKTTVPHQHAMTFKVENSTGNHIENTQNSFECYNSSGLQDCGYLYHAYNVYGDRTRDCWDACEGVDNEQCYQWIDFGKGYNCTFCYYCEVVRDCDYCFQVFNSEKCFGCVGINHGKYMILNEQYESDAWEKKVSEIKERMKKDGDFGKWPLAEGEKFDC